MPQALLQLAAVSKNYGSHQALSALSLEVHAGEIYCLLGHNGAGKTTTVNLILNFLKPSSGEISIAGHRVDTHPAQALAHTAYIPEQVALYPELNALENLRYFSRLNGQRYSSDELKSYLIDSGLPAELLQRRLRHYSKGMRQKVGIAIAMSKQARLLVLDEPTSGLDPSASYGFSQSLQKLAEAGIAIFMVTHDLFRVRELHARVGILSRGRLCDSFSAGAYTHQELEKRYLELAC